MSWHSSGRAVRWALISALALVALVGWWPGVAAAHPLDEYLQATYLTLARDGVTVELDLSPGVLVAPAVLAAIDTDSDGQISDQEGQVYGRAVLKDVTLDVDQQRFPLSLVKVELPTLLALTSGLGTIRLVATATDGADGLPIDLLPGPHEALVQNEHAPVKSVYQTTVALGAGGGIEVTRQLRDEHYQSLRVSYAVGPGTATEGGASAPAPAVVAPVAPPGDQTLAPPTEQSLAASAMLVSPAEAGLASSVGAWSSSSPVAGQRWLVDALYQPSLSPWLLVAALGLSALLGGLHALTPGHGKTLLASYLVGSRGTAGHAMLLGGTVTFTHTASVIAIGLLALLAGQAIVPALLVPTLELGSGLLVVLLGARLVHDRWQSLRHSHGANHVHDHEHPHSHGDGHPHHHSHADRRAHSHQLIEMVRWRDLLAMGVSGGLTPCPEAIGILLIAIGLNRIALGMGLIVAFSIGLAAVLCLLGLLLVRSRGLVDRIGNGGSLSQRTQQLLPLGSAVVVTGLGLAICAKGLLAYLA